MGDIETKRTGIPAFVQLGLAGWSAAQPNRARVDAEVAGEQRSKDPLCGNGRPTVDREVERVRPAALRLAQRLPQTALSGGIHVESSPPDVDFAGRKKWSGWSGRPRQVGMSASWQTFPRHVTLTLH